MAEPKVIVLTGASRGIGLSIAQYLLQASHKLVLVARSEEALKNLKSEYPSQVEYLAADLADFSVRFFVLLKSYVDSYVHFKSLMNTSGQETKYISSGFSIRLAFG